MPLPMDRLARSPRVWAALLAAALVVRLAFVETAPRAIEWADGRTYERAGWMLATEHRYIDNVHVPPGYPFFIAAVYSATGRDLAALRRVEAVLGTGTVALVGGFGATLFGPAAGLLAAVLAAFHPLWAFLPSTQYTENLLLFVSTLAFGTFALALSRGSAWRWALAGVCFGVAMLVKPAMTGLLPGFALGSALRLRREGPARLLRWGLAFAAAVAITLLPWMVRNHAHHGRWMLVSGGAGRSFYMGNNVNFTGETSIPPVFPDSLIRAVLAVRPAPDQDRVFYQAGWRFIRENPRRAAELYALRLRNLWALVARPSTRTSYTRAASDWALGLCNLLIFAGVLLGLPRVVRSGWSAFPLGVLSASLMVSFYYVVLRYRVSFEVLLVWMAAIGWWGWLEGRRRGST